MARPTKQGIDFFPVDVQFDDKIELLIAEKGGISVAILITLWQLIYQNEGYYISYSDDLLLLIKRRLMIESDVIKDVIHAAIKRKILSETKYKKYKILTSKAIQSRYFLASKKKKIVSVNKNYVCMGVSVGINGVNVDGNATKEKEKEKEKEEEKEKGESFEFFYNLYPLKKSKTVAEKSWYKLTESEKKDAINYLPFYDDSVKDKNYLKHPSTYLNQKVWLDGEYKKSTYNPMTDPKNSKKVADGYIWSDGYGWSL